MMLSRTVGELSRDGGGPGGVVSDQFAHTPLPSGEGTGKKTGFVDLEPVKTARGGTGAVAVAVLELA
jgi:hypothetical protein